MAGVVVLSPRMATCSIRGVSVVSYPRRQRYRRLSHAVGAATVSVAAALLAFVLAATGATSVAGALVVIAVGFGLYARH
jgi:hypothetical protein